jgi:F0F1-type ATP synthase membrane subunit b/b'
MENHSLWSVIVESNLINFLAFVGLIIWFIGKKMPGVVQQKNEEIESELRKANERCRLAEEQLAIAEKELSSFKANLKQMQEESVRRIQSLKEDLVQERDKKMSFLRAKCERDIANMSNNLKHEMEAKIAERALELAESLLKRQASDGSFNRLVIQNTLKSVELHPELLKN